MRLAMAMMVSALCFLGATMCSIQCTAAVIVVAQDGSGDFTTVQAAVQSIPEANRERTIIDIRDGVYNEKVRIDVDRVTLRGQSRKGTRIEFLQGATEFQRNRDNLGQAVININGDDVILQNLTAENLFPEVGPHAFTVFGRGTRTIIMDCDILSTWADTVSLWERDNGMYYHANCDFKGSVDFVCPRGWCFVRDCNFYEVKNTAALWHDGDGNPDEKFVLRDCTFDGVEGFKLGRRHREAHIYILGAKFSPTMADQPIWRVTYPDDPSRNQPNLWGDRYFYDNCRREGGEQFAWYADNLSDAPGSPKPEDITPAWTFGGKWDPERTDAPEIRSLTEADHGLVLNFGEDVTVHGEPQLVGQSGRVSKFLQGSGLNLLLFEWSSEKGPYLLNLNGGSITACVATVEIRSVAEGTQIEKR